MLMRRALSSVARRAPLAPTVPARRGSYLEAWLSTYDNARAGMVRLNPEVWGQPHRPDIVHTVVTWWRACQRQGTHSAKTRGEVSGTGKKPFPQKGRGAARHGSRRSPQWVGGGRVFPPKPRDYSYTLPKKIVSLGLKVALSTKYRTGQLVVLDGMSAGVDKTARLQERLSSHGLGLEVGKHSVLLVYGEEDDAAIERAARNLPWVTARTARGVNTIDVARHAVLAVSVHALPALDLRLAVEKRHNWRLPAEPDEPVQHASGMSNRLRRLLPPELEVCARVEDAPTLPWSSIDGETNRIVLDAPQARTRAA